MVLEIEKRAKPIIKWAGGKSKLLPQFKKYFPRTCKRYFEPFLGAGAVFLSLEDGTPAHLNDSNKELINLYATVRDYPVKLIDHLKGYESRFSEEFFYQTRSSSPENSIEKAARTIFLNKTGFNGLYRQNSKGKFNVPFGKKDKCPELYDEENLHKVSQRLKKAQISCLDFEEVIEQAEEGDFVYCDPPYEPLNKTSSFNSYQANGFSQTEQLRLKEACLRAKKRGVIVFISNSTSSFIQDLYKDSDFKIVTAKRLINSNSSLRGEINEVLIPV